MRRYVIAMVLILSLSEIAWAASYRFDMGGKNTPLVAGYTRVMPTTTLAKNPVFGWRRKARWVIFRDGPLNPYYGSADMAWEYSLYSDGVLSMEENTFEFKVDPGRYLVTAVIGDLEPLENRPGNSIWANGKQVVKNELTDGTVKSFSFPVDAPGSTISLRFRADSLQKYVTVMAVMAEPLAVGQDCKTSMAEYPAKQLQPKDYKRNWERYQSQFFADWEKAKEELKTEGVHFDFWAKKLFNLQKRKGYREYFPCLNSHWQRIDKLAHGISLKHLCKAFLEMGIDGFVDNNVVSAREFPKYGLKHAIYAGGESFWGMDLSACTLNLMKRADGSTATVARVWSNCDPITINAFRAHYSALAPVTKGASFFMIDEPRGNWFASGKFGDYSKPSQTAFKCWAAEHGWNDRAEKGIPERGRTMDFYRFYLFRLETPAMFIKACTKDTPMESIGIMPGNGNVGPELMNHSSYWPPAMARHGLISTSWSYDCPASSKMYAETVRIAEEYDGKSCITPPFSVYTHNTPIEVLPITTANISALTTKVSPFGKSTEEHNRLAWMKTIYYSSMLTHATSGLVHAPPLYVWCPDSIVYNDLVEIKCTESDNWKKLWQTLFDANIDYSVTNLLHVPKNAIVLYACVRPVLNKNEFARLQEFVKTGGTILTTFNRTPEFPDGTLIKCWNMLPKERIIHTDLLASALRKKVDNLAKRQNWKVDNKVVKTYCYYRGRRRVHLLNNTNLKTSTRVSIPVKVKDVFTNRVLKTGASLVIPAGHYAMLEEL